MKSHPGLFTTRRSFLRGSLLGGALNWTVPSFVAETFDALVRAAEGQPGAGSLDQPILVILQLAGGHDGLNCLVPFGNDHYRKARPQLALDANKVLKLDDQCGLAPELKPLRGLFDAGQLSIVQGVGYPNPNRSHFRSTDIWQTASDSDRVERHGWLGRYFDQTCSGADPVVGVNVGRQVPLAFAGPRPLGVSVENPETYRFQGFDESARAGAMASESVFRRISEDHELEMGAGESVAGSTIGTVGEAVPRARSKLDFIERVTLDAQRSSDRVLDITRRPISDGRYPATGLANSLRLVGRFIRGGLPTRVYYVSHGGYDTHTNQLGVQARLLRELAEALEAFWTDLKRDRLTEKVLVVTFSEFGRRVAENASGGTDHGAAGLMFALGHRLRAGLLGRHPSLAPEDLLNGDLRHTVDFRSVYAGVLEGWLKTPSEKVLGRRFEPLWLT